MAAAIPFGYKMSWLAVRASTPEHVVAALEIDGATPTSWQKGIEEAHASHSMSECPAFVTPELDGWVLVVSPAFFNEASDADPERLGTFVRDAAQSLGTEVQLFVTHRVVEGHAWARSDPTGTLRAYYYLGEVGECLLDEGDRTPFEDTLTCLRADAVEPADESTVMSVAAAWSLDPTSLDARFPQVDDGLLGTIGGHGAESADDVAPAADRPWWKFW